MLLVAGGGQGLTAVLTVERLAGPGAARFCPTRLRWPSWSGARIQAAEAQALACVAGTLRWWPAAERADVRWRLGRSDGEPLLRLQGGSAGAALALAVAKLCAPPGERLAALDLAQVAVTATIDEAGNLGAVAGLWEKLQAAALQAANLSLLRRVVVADQQAGVPPELLRPNAVPLRVIRAATLAQAVGEIYEEHGPRFAVREHERQACADLDILGRPAPIAAHYQALPLLREVPARAPAREVRGGERRPDAKDGEEKSALRLVDILRWEEEQGAEAVRYETVTAQVEPLFADFHAVVKDAKTAVPRFVVLGPPGSGKSTLAQYLTWHAADGALRAAGRPVLPARVRLREWEAWAVKSSAPETSLPEYLAAVYQDLGPAPADRAVASGSRGAMCCCCSMGSTSSPATLRSAPRSSRRWTCSRSVRPS